jgi:acetyltransferase-like isoleucine patch superfamily enzyme
MEDRIHPDSFVHPDAIVEPGATIGRATRVWAFAHVLQGARIGEECNICDHVFIESGVSVGDRVTIKCGVQLWDGVVIEDDVFLGPNATFTNDPFPRSKRRPARFAQTIVRSGASVSANATILPGLVIGSNAMVGAGAVVTHSVPPNAIVVGNPATIKGYVDAKTPDVPPAADSTQLAVAPRSVKGVTVYRMPLVTDLRGQLSVGEMRKGLPFSPQRYFLVFAVPSREVRGEHAHRTLHQFLTCVSGSCRLIVDDGAAREEIVLDDPSLGVHVEPMVWCTQYRFSGDAVLLVLASQIYDPADYVRDYDEFRALVARGSAG